MTKLYEAIAKQIADDIATGRLVTGDRLPPQRELADTLGVSLGTVTRGYAEAERRGLIHGRGRRGTIVGPGPNAPSLLASLAPRPGNAVRMIDFGGNYPIYEKDPELGPALQAIARRPDADQLLRYPPGEGLARHREIGAAWLRAQGVSVAEQDIVLTAGAQHAIMIVLSAYLSAGDVLLVGEVTYPGVLAAAQSLGITVKGVPLDEQGIDPQALSRLCRKLRPRALYCIPTLQNPTTAIMSAERKAQILGIAERYDLWIIEDEIHRMLLPHAPEAFYELAPERTFFITSVSKVLAGGLRLGFVLGPNRQRLLSGVRATMFAGSPLSAEVFATWWQDGTAMQVVRAKRKEARARQRLARRHLDALPVRLRGELCHHLWLELPPDWTPAALMTRAAQQGVALLPPQLFAADRDCAPNAMRLSLGAAEERASLDKGLAIIAAILASSPEPIAL